ncbi:hypothetical protein NGF19_04100 [Streptomyces sp. RY43-2]|uniref:Uncharacterized protein n=1 Tax=Streptomyces macrolidinus TaxID=2952607 RepID=A0ABT0Z881_9ACTN|nr:hypothetical protein [Streptomyces macrolidinus]MCN9239978.1 hypothetical protein [Streptomyces macrolidinus]
MTVDPTDPETFEEDETETVELDVEASEHDAAEQHAELSQEREEPVTEEERLRANEADLVEQKRVIHLDEDDYR